MTFIGILKVTFVQMSAQQQKNTTYKKNFKD